MKTVERREEIITKVTVEVGRPLVFDVIRNPYSFRPVTRGSRLSGQVLHFDGGGIDVSGNRHYDWEQVRPGASFPPYPSSIRR